MGLSRTVSEINGEFILKVTNFSHRRVFNDPADVVSVGICYLCMGKKTRMIRIPDGQQSFQIGIAV